MSASRAKSSDKFYYVGSIIASKLTEELAKLSICEELSIC